MKTTKLRKKLLVIIIPVITVSILLLIAVAYFSSKKAIETKSEELLESIGGECASNIDAWEEETLATLDTAVKTIIGLDMTKSDILKYEELFLGTYDAFPNGIYIAQKDKSLIDASGWEPDFDVTTSSWYKEGLEHPDSMLFGEPYIDEFTGNYIVTATRHTKIAGMDSTVAADVELSIISNEVSELNIIADGDAFIVDISSGIILASKNADLVSKNVYELSDVYFKNVCEAIKVGNYNTNTFGSYITAINPIDNTDWFLVTRALQNKVFSDVRTIGIILIGIGILALTSVIVIIALLINKTTRPITDLNDAISKVTDGDFTVNLSTEGNDEIANMTRNMDKYIVSMKAMLREIIESAKTIDTQAESSYAVSGELNSSSNEQVGAMDILLGNLGDLVDSVGVIAENATSLAQTVMGITNSSNEAIATMTDTKADAESGKSSMLEVNVAMKHIEDGMSKLEASITDVGEAAVKIEEITSTIKSIASKTNLLALNASIEAARAGEAGRGFAVVADEIKSLAETSANAANEISELIVNVTKLIDTTVDESKVNAEKVAESVSLVDKASEQFNSIYAGIEKTNTLVSNVISDIIQANDVATNMAAITEEQSAAAQEIETNAVNIKKLAEAVQSNGEEVKAQSEELARASETLRSNMDKFTI